MSERSVPLPPRREPETRHREDAARVRTFRSEELFEGTREILIEHAGETYRLRLTRNGKLILQK